jgi:hypothetical protein
MLTATGAYFVTEYGWENLPEFFFFSIAILVVTLLFSS